MSRLACNGFVSTQRPHLLTKLRFMLNYEGDSGTTETEECDPCFVLFVYIEKVHTFVYIGIFNSNIIKF